MFRKNKKNRPMSAEELHEQFWNELNKRREEDELLMKKNYEFWKELGLEVK